MNVLTPQDRIFGQLICQYNNKEFLYLSDKKNIMDYISIWQYNRPIDETRIQVIKEYIEKQKYVDGIIYVAEFQENKKISYNCYDGFHRLKALQLIKDDLKIIVHVTYQATVDQIKSKFKALNSAISVPELYLDETNDETIQSLKIIIEEVVEYICKKWSKYQSISKRPQRPNFNRDNLKDQLYDYINQPSHIGVNASRLIKAIDKLNEDYSNRKFVNTSQKVISKCKKMGCFLFLKRYFTDDLQI
uniref:ParB/Sulfiredoxin domain-containing protein n=1 Tax=Marseillevirus LCMAC102 TaxID=2506603 RepID=A0A481YSP1_9VIRU|nr:MAG: hypothetical protein LCMAC102_00330 [Marseillevirus LCMAC102]